MPEDSLVYDEELDPSEEYVTYPYRIAHPILRIFVHEAGTVPWRQFSERATNSKEER